MGSAKVDVWMYDRALMGKRIWACRKYRGYTQDEVAENCEMSKSYLSIIENGLRSPSLDTLYKLSIFLNFSIDWLLNRPQYLQDVRNAEVPKEIEDLGIW